MTVNQQVLEGNWTEIKGKLRERWGHLSNDELESAHGNFDQLVGTIERKTGEARDAVERYLEELTHDGASAISKAASTVREYAEAAGESVVESAREASDAVAAGYARTEQLVQRRPLESVAVCFGAGLVTGVVVGLLMQSR